MKVYIAILILLLAACAYLASVVWDGEIQHASDRICVPLYDETGLECCQ